MESKLINRKRSQLFIHIYGALSIFHFLLNQITDINTAVISPFFGISTYLLLQLFITKMNERALQYAMLFAMNFYIFILNFESSAPITLIYFVVPIIICALYNETKPILYLGLLTAIEFVLFLTVYDRFVPGAPLSYNQLSIVVFTLSIFFLTLLHSLYFSRYWKQLEAKNASMEKALLSKEGYLQLFFETAKDAIAVFDSEEKIIAVNPAFEELYGWTSEECIGQSLPIYSAENTLAVKMRTQQVQQGKSYSLLETEDVRKDGSRFHAQITLSPIFDDAEKVVATSMISRDISYQKESEKLMVQTEKLKLAGEIAAGVAHEIRNPMTVISGFIQMMHHDPKHRFPEYTELIQSELDRINLIISEFLVLAKPQAATLKVFSVQKALDDILLLFSSELNMNGVTLVKDWEKDFQLNGEEHHLKQVFINLLKNAVESMQEPGEVRVSLKAEENDMFSISFEDTGKGISEKDLNEIFEPFFTTKASGTGLGLIVSQKIIQEHKGKLSISSARGIGTVAKILLQHTS
ncbi:two-component sensor histidine kinase [Planococcus donghaensis MPA1U2]|uniref:histidine kinase n=1 Tax=Planococcus donghaensis MPA1U2 TaxID=933115 RepID=E7RF96_9BACL|nr:ATP-binding protein [Planococcus donghaensis]EGA90316.1 two-component sensor histidine kinase [Planococcus donghaensis MPA1U2]